VQLLSLERGLPRDIEVGADRAHGRFEGRVLFRRRSIGYIDATAQGDLLVTARAPAVLVYQIDCPTVIWKGSSAKDFVFGQSVENFTVEDWPDDEVASAPFHRMCAALFEVTTPRDLLPVRHHE